MPPSKFIASKDNPRLVKLRRIRDGRDRERIFIEGRRLADEAFADGLANIECYIREDRYTPDLRDRYDQFVGERSFVVKEKIFRSLADTAESQGIILTADRPSHRPADVFARFKNENAVPIAVMMESANNPSNVGAVIRTAAAAGAAGVIVSGSSADPFSPKSLRASMGAAFRIPVVESQDVADILEAARKAGCRLVGTSPVGGSDIYSAKVTEKTLYVFGSEAHGMTEKTAAEMDTTVRIPMADTESLNLAVACGIILFEAARRLRGSAN